VDNEMSLLTKKTRMHSMQRCRQHAIVHINVSFIAIALLHHSCHSKIVAIEVVPSSNLTKVTEDHRQYDL